MELRHVQGNGDLVVQKVAEDGFLTRDRSRSVRSGGIRPPWKSRPPPGPGLLRLMRRSHVHGLDDVADLHRPVPCPGDLASRPRKEGGCFRLVTGCPYNVPCPESNLAAASGKGQLGSLFRRDENLPPQTGFFSGSTGKCRDSALWKFSFRSSPPGGSRSRRQRSGLLA